MKNIPVGSPDARLQLPTFHLPSETEHRRNSSRLGQLPKFKMKLATQTIISLTCYTVVAGFLSPSHKATVVPRVPVERSVNWMVPDYESTSLLLSEEAKDYGEFVKSFFIVLLFGGGLIPAAIGANAAMLKTLSGKKETVDVDAGKSGESFDPSINETKYRAYVESGVGADGPILPFSSLLFATEPVKLVDIIAILGRIENENSIADWKNLPSTKLPNVSLTNPPMWLPRRAFKVAVRKAKFLGWPNDPKTGEPVGGSELKAQYLSAVSKKEVSISDVALDAVFDSWAWGASIATPDKVQKTLRIFKSGSSDVDLGAFTGAAIRGRSATGLAALTFILIQVTAYGTLFVAPALRFFFDIDIGFGTLGAK